MDLAKISFISLAVITIVLAITFSNAALGKNTSPSGMFVLSGIDADQLDQYFENGELKPEYVQQINENADQIPEFVMESLAQGKTNVTIVTDGGQKKEFSVVVQGKNLLGASQGRSQDADAAIEVSEGTIKKIANSQSPLETISQAMNSGEIKYTAMSDEAKPKELLVSILSFFAGIANAIFSFFTKIFGR